MATQISNISKQIDELKNQLEDARQQELYEKSAKDAATMLKALYDAYVFVGFAEEQAYELIQTTLKNQGGK